MILCNSGKVGRFFPFSRVVILILHANEHENHEYIPNGEAASAMESTIRKWFELTHRRCLFAFALIWFRISLLLCLFLFESLLLDVLNFSVSVFFSFRFCFFFWWCIFNFICIPMLFIVLHMFVLYIFVFRIIWQHLNALQKLGICALFKY